MAKFFFVVAFAATALHWATPTSASIHFRFEEDDVLLLSLPFGNDFRNQIAQRLGTTSSQTVIVKASATATARGTIDFYAHAQESAFNNRFEVLGQLRGGGGFSENTPFTAWSDSATPFATIYVNPGDRLDELVQFATDGKKVPPAAHLGDDEFGVFLPTTTAQPPASAMTFFFGYDDNGAGPDDDYDDLVIRGVFRPESVGGTLDVPEPASLAVWALLTAAIGALSLRRSGSRR